MKSKLFKNSLVRMVVVLCPTLMPSLLKNKITNPNTPIADGAMDEVNSFKKFFPIIGIEAYQYKGKNNYLLYQWSYK